MSKQFDGTITGRVYENGTQFMGLAKVTLPDVDFEIFSIKGLGLCGEMERPALGQFKPLTLTLEFWETSSSFYILGDQREHEITLDVAKQVHNLRAGEIPTSGDKYVFRCMPKKRTGGTVENASQQNVSLDFAVAMMKEMIDGKIVQHIDVDNYIFKGYDGVDRAAPIRKALGMSY